MVQSESNNAETAKDATPLKKMPLPRRSLSIEFAVGVFTLVCSLAGAWLAVGLGGAALFPTNDYTLFAEFDNISGLKEGASVEIAGVQIGTVTQIALKDPAATVSLQLDRNVAIHDDDIASIRTKGIIGDRYVKISRGGAGEVMAPGSTITETESVVDIEEIIGKIVHSMTGKDDEKDGAGEK